ncbi:MAG: AraC family transcriptional regulator, partial [Porphyromonadaceae bacterium]|nr:AraC family transcriptional regulator [Porphyromonadaceae bacterium]
MRDLLSEAIFTVTIVRLLTTIYLFARCREGERSRIILAIISLFTIFHYASRYWTAIHGQLPMQVVSTPMLLIALFMITSFIMYPIEVVSPGWINFKRIILLYSPVGVLYGIWQITLWCGVEYSQYNSLQEMLPYISNFDVWFRFILCFLILCPVLFIFFVPYTKKYSNTTYRWKWIYATIFSINTFVFLVVLWERTITTSVLYYYIGTGCFLAIAYAELSTRIIRYPISETFSPEMSSKVFEEVLFQSEPSMPANSGDKTENTNSVLFNRLDEYMKRNAAWRDPDLTLNKLSAIMHTNRTTLSIAIQKSEYGNYTAYINKLRFDDFVYCVTTNSLVNYQDAFYDAGFRSRTTALRNFRQITGMTPTEYFTGNNIKTDR